MPEVIKIPGRRVEPHTELDSADAEVRIEVKYKIAVEPAVRGAGDEYQIITNLSAGSLIEIEYHSGIRRWLSSDQLREDLRAQQAKLTRGELIEPGVLYLPITFGATASTRDGAVEAVKYFTELFIDFGAEGVAELGARALVEHIEGNLLKGSPLKRISDPRLPGEAIDHPDQIAPGAPLLLFVHGTASNTLGSFGDLSGTAEWKDLSYRFPDAVYALEHCTLSKTPVQNAIEAATLLPAGAKLNLVTHSRGGLVGELLCLPTDLSLTPESVFDEDRTGDRRDFERLLKLLREKQFDVQRFVRVACPARGTLLASKRLDLYLSVLLNLVGMLPLFQGNPFFGFIKALLKKLIALKADPYRLPGLEAQMPDSPLIHLLNRPDISSKANLAVITGDSHGGRLFQALSTFAVDVFFRQKHDFVVNTSAMYGGFHRTPDAYYFDDSGEGVCHFHYFKNGRTRQQMSAWLASKAGQAPGDFAKLAYRERNLIFPSLRGGANLPNLIFIPGLLGTHLLAEGKTIWLDYTQLLPGSVDRIAFGAGSVRAGELLARPYQRLLNDLNTSFAVLPFGYDWRLPVHENAAALAAFVRDKAGQWQSATYLLADDSGGMLLEALVAEHPDTWRAIRHSGGKAIAIGHASEAARSAASLVKGTHKLARLLELLDRRPAAEIGKLFGVMPGVRDVGSWTNASPFPEGMHCITGPIRKGDALPSSAWFAEPGTGSLLDVPFLADVIRDILRAGITDRLSPTARVETQNEVDQRELLYPLLYPTEPDLAEAAFGAERVSGPEPMRINLRVKHGHLREAEFPVAVGHYRGDGIVSAEKVLDRQLKGLLSENFQLDLYPGPEGTAEVLELRDAQPPGALVIGLGDVGAINAGKITRGVALAALRYALGKMRAMEPDAGHLTLGISALLLGTYAGNALSVRDSIQAIAAGVVQANHSLQSQAVQSQRLSGGVAIETIEFIELYEDLAIQAAHEIVDLEKRSRRDARDGVLFVAAPQLNSTVSGLFHRPGNPYQNGWWRRIRVEANETGLQFTVLTDRAGADFSVKPTQRDLVAACVEKAVTNSVYDPHLARVLFDLLLPPGIKDQIRERTSLVFVVDQNSAHFPWEMLAQRDGETVEPLANRIGMLRQLVSEDTPKKRTSRRLSALVVGPPLLPEPSRWPKLPQAEEEAREVDGLLKKAGYEVTFLDPEKANPVAILAGVFSENRILHLAGHGVYNKKDPARSGFVIGEDLYLSAAEITSVEPVPELVFLNCCYGGSIPQTLTVVGQPNRLAGSLATELIKLGVKAVVVSGWAVNDEAAKQFALDFYAALLGGAKFGEAVLRARASTFNKFQSTNTWGAYQCYGNPDFALSLTSTREEEAPAQNDFVARRELLERVRNIEALAVDVQDSTRVQLLQELTTIDRFAAGKWDDGEVLSDIGAAYAALLSSEEAIDAYRRAFHDPQSKIPVKAVEQYVNLLYRKAERKNDDEHKALFDKAHEKVSWTIQLGRTVERLSLMGSLYKREALWEQRKGNHERRNEHLGEALQWYRKACNPQQAVDPQCDAYPELNAAAIELLLDQANSEAWKAHLREIAGAAQRKAREGSVWYKAAFVDASLLQEIQAKTIHQRAVQDELIKRYQNVLQAATRRQRDSVVSQMILLRDLFDSASHTSEIAGLTCLIEALEIKSPVMELSTTKI